MVKWDVRSDIDLNRRIASGFWHRTDRRVGVKSGWRDSRHGANPVLTESLFQPAAGTDFSTRGAVRRQIVASRHFKHDETHAR